MLGWFGQIGRLWVIYSKADLGWIDWGKSGSVYAASSCICTTQSRGCLIPSGLQHLHIGTTEKKESRGRSNDRVLGFSFQMFLFLTRTGKVFHDLRRLYIDVIEQPCHCFINICLIAHLAFCPTGTVRNSWWKTNFCYISVGVSLWMWMGYVNLTTYDSVWPSAQCIRELFSWKNFLLFTVVQGLVNRCGWIIERTNQDQISIWFLWMAHSLKRWRTPYTLQSKVWKRLWFLIHI